MFQRADILSFDNYLVEWLKPFIHSTDYIMYIFLLRVGETTSINVVSCY